MGNSRLFMSFALGIVFDSRNFTGEPLEPMFRVFPVGENAMLCMNIRSNSQQRGSL